MHVKAGTYNLRNGGLDGGDPARLHRQGDMLAALDLDLLAVQEAKWPDPAQANRLLHEMAHRLGMGWRVLVAGNHHDCHLALFVREHAGLRVARERHDRATPWWHALAAVELEVAGRDRPLHFVNVHFAPGNPSLRELEATAIKFYCKDRDVVFAGDVNAAGLGDKPRTEGIDPDHVADKTDQRAAQQLRKAKLTDVAAYVGDPTPTVGHLSSDRLQIRCDQIHTTLPPSTIRGYRVVVEDEPHSDHRPVVSEFDLSTRPAAPPPALG